MSNRTRRLLLQAALGGLAAVTMGLAKSRSLLASWPKAAFTSPHTDTALEALIGTSERDLIPSDKIRLEIPDSAENGAIVPLTVDADLQGAESITVLATKNPHPLTSSYLIPAGTLAYVSTRIKMQETANVIAIVKANGKCYSASKHVKVAIGGCS